MSKESEALKKLAVAVPERPQLVNFSPEYVGQQAFFVGPSKAFVRDPKMRGRWILVPRPVAEWGCLWCKAEKYQPCHNPRTGHTWTQIHIARRRGYNRK